MLLKFDEFINEQSLNEDLTVSTRKPVKVYDDGAMQLSDSTEIDSGEKITLKGVEKYSKNASDKDIYDIGIINYKGKKYVISKKTYNELKYLN